MKGPQVDATHEGMSRPADRQTRDTRNAASPAHSPRLAELQAIRNETGAAASTRDDIVALQRDAGNTAVTALLDARPRIAQRSALDDNTTKEERGKLRVLTLEHVSMLTLDEIKQRMTDKNEPRPPADEVRFGSAVDEKVKRGLKHLAVEFAGNELRPDSIVSVPLNLKPFGGVNGVYRFIRVARKTKPKRLLIIDQVSARPPATLTKAGVEKQEKRFTQFGFRFGSGFGADDDKKQLYTALARVPDASLSRARGVRFVRRLQDVGERNEPGHYDPNTNTITLFGAAKQTFLSSSDAGGSDWFTYALMHELGHALDFGPFALALAKRDNLERELAEARRRAAQIQVDPNAGLDASDKADAQKQKDRREVVRLTKELAKAEAALRKVSPGSKASSYSTGKAYGKVKGAPISSYGKKGGKVEDFAELFALYTLDPELLKSIRPDKYKYFSETFK
jgi:hypothetical protein